MYVFVDCFEATFREGFITMGFFVGDTGNRVGNPKRVGGIDKVISSVIRLLIEKNKLGLNLLLNTTKAVSDNGKTS